MMESRLLLHPVLPLWLLALLTLAAACLLAATYRRCPLTRRARAGLLAIRLLTILILVGLLLQPVLRLSRHDVETPALAVLLDVSASMRDSPAEDRNLRFKNLTKFLRSRAFRDRAEKYRLQWYEYGADLTEIEDPGKGDVVCSAARTQTLAALNDLSRRARGLNLAGVILLSDGLDQSLDPLTPEAARCPVFVPELEPHLPPPKAAAEADVMIADVAHPKMLVVNWQANVDVSVQRSQSAGKLVCPVHLYRGTERLRTGYATFGDGETHQYLSFSIEPDRVGRVVYRVQLEPPTDSNPENNEQRFVVDVTDPRNRLLYIEGAARWEFKFLKRALLKEPNYHLAAFVQLGGGRFINFAEEGGTAEVTGLPELVGEKVLNYRVVVLGEMPAAVLTAQQQDSVAEFVDKGGGLLLLGGRLAWGPSGWPASPGLAKVLPFSNGPGASMHEGRFSLVISPGAANHPVLTGLPVDAGLPPVISRWGPAEPRPGSTVLVQTADGDPLLLTRRYGEGKVAVLLSDSLWRWQLGAPLTGTDRSFYEQFVSQLVHWLAPQEEEIEEKGNLQVLTHAAEVELREPVLIGATIGERAGGQPVQLSCTVKTPDDRQLEIPLARGRLGADFGLSKEVAGWRADYVPHIAGEYVITVREPVTGESADVRILVNQPQLEMTGHPLNREFLQNLASSTGGAFMSLDRIDDLMDRIPYDPVETEITEERAQWNHSWILLLLILLFSLEWYLRTKLDLV